jgi:hypothetical protein
MTNLDLSRRCLYVKAVAVVLVVFASTAMCHAEALLTQKALSVEAALSVANGALEKCHADGYRISLTVLDAGG